MKYLVKSKETFPPSADYIAPYAAFLELSGESGYGALESVLEELSGKTDLIPPNNYSALGAPYTALRRDKVTRLIGEVLESGYVELFLRD